MSLNEASQATPQKGDKLEPIVGVLAYFTAARKYSYVDALSGALNPEVAKAVIADALRDFAVSCGEGVSRDECVACPKIDPSELKEAVNLLDRMLAKQGGRFFETIRSITLKALGMAPSLRRDCNKEG